MTYNLTGIPLDPKDPETAVMIDAALKWIQDNTTLELDPEAELPSNVKLFIVKFTQLFSQPSGVASESLGGMSQSFSTSGGTAFLLSDLASQLFGAAYKGRNRFIPLKSRWK